MGNGVGVIEGVEFVQQVIFFHLQTGDFMLKTDEFLIDNGDEAFQFFRFSGVTGTQDDGLLFELSS